MSSRRVSKRTRPDSSRASEYDSVAKDSVFLLPLSHLAPPFPMFPLVFPGEVNHEETRVTGLFSSKDRMLVV